MSASSERLHLFQLSISTVGVQRSHDWYSREFGLVPSGGMRPAAVAADRDEQDGRHTSDLGELQGIPGARLEQVLWLLDRRDFFQFELFEYSAPPVRPSERDVWDIGYASIGLHVADFDGTVASLVESGAPSLGPVIGERGARRWCTRDPDNVVVEVMEDEVVTPVVDSPARPEMPTVARSVRLSVPDLSLARRFWLDTLGLQEADPDTLHRLEHEQLWGLDRPSRDVALFHAEDFWVELVSYQQPRPRPWPHGYQLSDQGIFNIGLSTRDRGLYLHYRQRVLEAGYTVRPTHSFDGLDVTYLVDDQGFSVQLNHNGRAHDVRLGLALESS